jgi:hypothetical protein
MNDMKKLYQKNIDQLQFMDNQDWKLWYLNPE